MTVSPLRPVVGLLLVSASSLQAATIEISARFSPSLTDPDSHRFINTTPQSGHCQQFPALCKEDKSFSIALPVTTRLQGPIKADDAPRNNPYFVLPNKPRTVTLTNTTTGEQKTMTFRASAFSGEFPTSKNQGSWQGGTFTWPNSPCQFAAYSWGSTDWYHFIWKLSEGNGACYKISSVDRTEPDRFYNMSIAYELGTPNPLSMGSGEYTGTLNLSIGSGGDFDFGDAYLPSDSQLTLSFTLTVAHELRLSTTPEAQTVSLQPCPSGTVCTAQDDNAALWEAYDLRSETPQLSGRSPFMISSTGRFTAYLQCDEQSGQQCALKSDTTGQLVPVTTLLTLPDNIVDASTQNPVIKRTLLVGKSTTQNIFTTQSVGVDRQGSIDFIVPPSDVEKMLLTRPDTYRGAVTVIFDPQLD